MDFPKPAFSDFTLFFLVLAPKARKLPDLSGRQIRQSIWHRRRDSNRIYQSRTSQPHSYQIFCQLLYTQRAGILHQLRDAIFRICDIFTNCFVEYLFVHLVAIAQAIANETFLIINTDGMTVHGSGCHTRFQYGRLHVIRFYARNGYCRPL